MKYRDLNDYELINYVSEDEDAKNMIFEKYKPLIMKTATKMYKYCTNSGLEINDLVQEGMLGLNLALRNYDQNKDAIFYTYAKKCIERKIISAVVGTTRLKHKILNESFSYEKQDENISYDRVLEDNSYNPLKLLINLETENEFIEKSHNLLTNFEMQVFDLKIAGFSYKEIADFLEKDSKQIDNAIQRIKTKLGKTKE